MADSNINQFKQQARHGPLPAGESTNLFDSLNRDVSFFPPVALQM